MSNTKINKKINEIFIFESAFLMEFKANRKNSLTTLHCCQLHSVRIVMENRPIENFMATLCKKHQYLQPLSHVGSNIYKRECYHVPK